MKAGAAIKKGGANDAVRHRAEEKVSKREAKVKIFEGTLNEVIEGVYKEKSFASEWVIIHKINFKIVAHDKDRKAAVEKALKKYSDPGLLTILYVPAERHEFVVME